MSALEGPALWAANRAQLAAVERGERARPQPRSGAPLVSIVVPSFNQGRFLAETLDSILSQDYRPLEIVVQDGASRDDTVSVLERYAALWPELKWRSEPDRGVWEAVNRGLERARGLYCGIQSSDDLYLPGAISAAVAALEQNPRAGLVYGDGYAVTALGERMSPTFSYAEFTPTRFHCRWALVMQSSAFFRTALAREAGGWRPDYFVADCDLWLRMVYRAPFAHVPQALSVWRHHDQQRDTQGGKIWNGYGRMIAESVELKRAPLSHRLAARAGWRVMALDYYPGSRLGQLWQLWRAVLAWPPAVRALFHRWPRLFPGSETLKRLAGRA